MLFWIEEIIVKSKILQIFLIMFWSFLTVLQIAIAFIMIIATNLILNGYNEKCGLKSAIPFMCDNTSHVGLQSTNMSSTAVIVPASSATATNSTKPVEIPPKSKAISSKPQSKMKMNVNCGNGGICYHNQIPISGHGIAYDDWGDHK